MKRRNAVKEPVEPRRQRRFPPGSVEEKIVLLSEQVPDSEWARVPTDGAINHDHYLYGSPKKR